MGPKGSTTKGHVTQDLGYNPQYFYLIYTDLSIPEKSPLWKVLSHISVHNIFLYIVGYNIS